MLKLELDLRIRIRSRVHRAFAGGGNGAGGGRRIGRSGEFVVVDEELVGLESKGSSGKQEADIEEDEEREEVGC